MQDQTSFQNAVSLRRAVPLQSALLMLRSYMAGETRLTSGSSLSELFGDYHCALLWDDLKHRYGVTETAGVLTVDPQRVQQVIGASTKRSPMQAVMEDFGEQLQRCAALAVQFPDMYHVDRDDAQRAMFEVAEAATLRAMQDTKSR